MDFKYCIPVYHVNSPETVRRVINSFEIGDGELYTTEEDGYWAGNGMYFWDNEGNANYWKRNRKRHKGLESKMLIADLSLDENNVLDLTDEETLDTYYKLWPVVAKKYKINIDCSPGKKLNFICKALGNIKVVKVCGYYPQKNYAPFFEGNIHKPHMTNKARIIFCVKNSDRLKNVTSVE